MKNKLNNIEKQPVKLGTQIDFIEDKIKDFINNEKMLSGDERRMLSLRKEYSDFFLLGYFNDNTCMVGIIDKDINDEGEKNIQKLIIPSNSIKKNSTQKKLDKRFDLFDEGFIDKEVWSKKVDDESKYLTDKMTKMFDLQREFLGFFNKYLYSIQKTSFFKFNEEFKLKLSFDELGELTNFYKILIEITNNKKDKKLDKYFPEKFKNIEDFFNKENFKKGFHNKECIKSGILNFKEQYIELVFQINKIK